MLAPVDPTQLYGTWYYHSYAMPYEQENWAAVMANIAHGVVTQINPRTVLDAGCAKGFLVAALRDRGVEAFGMDVSAVAVANAPDSVRDHVRVGSLTEPIEGRYDLVTCIEVIEHLDPVECMTAVRHLCACTDTILLSTTPGDQDEPTHVNVQPPERWAQLFAAHGFLRDFDHDGSYVAPWAVLYRRRSPSTPEVVAEYEHSIAEMSAESKEQRSRLTELRERLATSSPPEPPSAEESSTEERSVLEDLREEIAALCLAYRALDERLGAVLGQLAEGAAALERSSGSERRLAEICASRSWRLAQVAGLPFRSLRSVIR